MSVAAGGGGPSGVDPKKPMLLGIIGGLLGIYATPINPVIGPLFAAIGAVCAIVWGADAIARVASYGLGTGVPSIGYMSLAVAIVGAIAGLAGGLIPGVPSILGPLLGFIIAMVIGAIVAFLLVKIVKMKIPVMVRCTVELTGAATLSVLGFSAALAGSYALPAILTTVVATGYIVLLFILNTMAIQHPFNACLGPNESRMRTLKLAASTGFISMAVVGVLGIKISPAWWVIAIIGALAWFISIRSFIKASVEDAASVAWTGWWPRNEEGEL
jgi:tetrahydromethanopterin S-methyltransferase subunit C